MFQFCVYLQRRKGALDASSGRLHYRRAIRLTTLQDGGEKVVGRLFSPHA